MKKYYLQKGENPEGPFSIEDLKSRKVTKETLIWFEGTKDWIKASEIAELNTLFNIQTPPPINTPKSTPPPIKPASISKRKILVYLVSIILIGIIAYLIVENNKRENNLNQIKSALQQEKQEKIEKERIAEEERIEIEKQQEIEAKKKVALKQAQYKKNLGFRNNWQNYIIPSPNRYTYSDLGGISNLKAIVYNKTDVNLEEVHVQVDYIKANGDRYMSKTVTITNISPNSSKEVSMPSSDRGTSVKMKIVNIASKELNFCYPNGGNKRSDIDPYLCK